MKRIVLIGFAILVLAAATGYGMMGGGQGGMMGGGQRGPIVGNGMVPKEIMIDVMQMMKGVMAIQQDIMQGMSDTEKDRSIIRLSVMMMDLDRMMAAINAAQ